jgi:hypothetical protein
MLASVPLAFSANLLNDPSKTTFTDVVMLPFLNMAIEELNEQLELNNVGLTNALSAIIPVTAGLVTIANPANYVEIQELFERDMGATQQDFAAMDRVDFLPEYSVLAQSLIYWAWIDETIQFIGATSDRDIRIHYIASRLSAVASGSDTIGTVNAELPLGYRTASLCARYIYENATRADALDAAAAMALDVMLSINVKGGQAITTRRQPFRASWKNRTTLI